jgi:hypothetical protein
MNQTASTKRKRAMHTSAFHCGYELRYGEQGRSRKIKGKKRRTSAERALRREHWRFTAAASCRCGDNTCT